MALVLTGTASGGSIGTPNLPSGIVINSNGQTTEPIKPAFMAVNITGITGNGSENKVTSWATGYAYCFNTGNHFDTVNQRFTAPVAGKYYFSAQLMPSGDANTKYMVPAVNGNRAPTYVLPYLSAGSTRATIDFSIILNLSAGDYVEVRSYAATGSSFDNSGYFCGFLLG